MNQVRKYFCTYLKRKIMLTLMYAELLRKVQTISQKMAFVHISISGHL